MRLNILDIRITSLLSVLVIAVCIAFESCYTLNTVESFSFLDLPLLAVLIALLATRKDVGPSSGVLRLGFAVVLAFVFGSVIVNFSLLTIVNTLKIVLVLIASYLVAKKMDVDEFLSASVIVLEVVTVLALALWISTNVLGVELPLPEVVNRNGVSYQSGIVVFQFAHYAGTTPAMGIFWEGGVFASFLLVAIALWAARIVKCANRTIVIFVLGAFASGSTAGLLLIPLAFAPRFFATRNSFRVVALIVMLVAITLVLFNLNPILLYLYGISPDLFGKVIDLNQLTTSTRLISPAANLSIFLESPIFGKGMGNAAVEYSRIVNETSAIDSQTSTSAFLMAAFGVGGIVINALWFIAILGQKDLVIEQRVLLIVLFALILNKETHVFTMFMYCLLFLLLKRSNDHEEGSKV